MTLLLGGVKGKEQTKLGEKTVFDQLFTGNQTKTKATEELLEKAFEKIGTAMSEKMPLTEKSLASLLDKIGIKGEMQTDIIQKVTEFLKKESVDLLSTEPVVEKTEETIVDEKKEEKSTDVQQNPITEPTVVEDLAKLVVSLFVEMKKNEPEVTVPIKNEGTEVKIDTVTLTKPAELHELKELKEMKEIVQLVNEGIKVEKESQMQPVITKAIEKQMEHIEKTDKTESKKELEIKIDAPTGNTDVKSMVAVHVPEVKTEPVKVVPLNELKTFVQKEMNTYADIKTISPKKIVLQLNPENLGKIEIQLEKKEDGTLTAILKVHEADAKDVVEKVMEEAKKELNDKGTIIDVQVTSSNDQQNKEEKRKEQHETVPNDKKEIKDDETFDEIWQEQLGG